MPIKQAETVAARRTVYITAANTADSSAYTGALVYSDLKIKKPGAAEASANASCTLTHINTGLFEVVLTASDVDTLGEMSLRLNKTGVFNDVRTVTVVGYDPFASANLGLTNLDTTVGSRLPTSSYETLSTQLDTASTVETGLSLRGLYRALASVLLGKISGAGTGTEVFRNAVADSKARVTASVDSAGNRTSVTIDQT